jgi:Tol biopolymer transport system component
VSLSRWTRARKVARVRRRVAVGTIAGASNGGGVRNIRLVGWFTVFSLMIGLAPASLGAYTRPGVTEEADLSGNGAQAQVPPGHDCGLNITAVSADGRYVVFDSSADNLVAGDVNQGTDVFVRDRRTGTTTLVSVGLDGKPAIGVPFNTCGDLSVGPTISADGRYVAFVSTATDLVKGDTNGVADVFVRDLQRRVTERVSVRSGGAQAGSPLNTILSTSSAAISADGRYVTFTSWLSDLAANDTNNASDVFWHDNKTDVTKMVSVTSSGAQADAGQTNPFLIGSFGSSMSADGRFVAFASHAPLVADDTNGEPDVFVHDTKTGRTERDSVASDGEQGVSPTGIFGGAWTNSSLFPNQSISADGRRVTFYSYQSNLVPNDSNAAADYFVHDRATGLTKRVSVDSFGEQTNVDAAVPSISGNGRFVAFATHTPGLVADDQATSNEDAFVYDQQTGAVELVSRATNGRKGNGGCTGGNPGAVLPYLSATGQFATFSACYSNLSNGPDRNPTFDAFVRDRGIDLGTGELLATAHSSTTGERTSSSTGRTFRQSRTSPLDAVLAKEGAELTVASVAYRPGSADLFGRLELKDMPTFAAADPAIIYGLDLSAHGQRYEVRVAKEGVAPAFGLFRLDNGSWTQIERLRGGYGTTGNEVVFALPLHDIRERHASRIGISLAFASIGSFLTGTLQNLDEIHFGQ